MKTIYIVRYCGGDYDSSYQVNLFVTDKKSTATKYVTKFNRILKKWKEHYKQYETKDYGFNWIEDKYVELYYDRCSSLRNIDKCYYNEIDLG